MAPGGTNGSTAHRRHGPRTAGNETWDHHAPGAAQERTDEAGGLLRGDVAHRVGAGRCCSSGILFVLCLGILLVWKWSVSVGIRNYAATLERAGGRGSTMFPEDRGIAWKHGPEISTNKGIDGGQKKNDGPASSVLLPPPKASNVIDGNKNERVKQPATPAPPSSVEERHDAPAAAREDFAMWPEVEKFAIETSSIKRVIEKGMGYSSRGCACRGREDVVLNAKEYPLCFQKEFWLKAAAGGRVSASTSSPYSGSAFSPPSSRVREVGRENAADLPEYEEWNKCHSGGLGDDESGTTAEAMWNKCHFDSAGAEPPRPNTAWIFGASDAISLRLAVGTALAGRFSLFVAGWSGFDVVEDFGGLLVGGGGGDHGRIGGKIDFTKQVISLMRERLRAGDLVFLVVRVPAGCLAGSGPRENCANGVKALADFVANKGGKLVVVMSGEGDNAGNTSRVEKLAATSWEAFSERHKAAKKFLEDSLAQSNAVLQHGGPEGGGSTSAAPPSGKVAELQQQAILWHYSSHFCTKSICGLSLPETEGIPIWTKWSTTTPSSSDQHRLTPAAATYLAPFLCNHLRLNSFLPSPPSVVKTFSPGSVPLDLTLLHSGHDQYWCRVFELDFELQDSGFLTVDHIYDPPENWANIHHMAIWQCSDSARFPDGSDYGKNAFRCEGQPFWPGCERMIVVLEQGSHARKTLIMPKSKTAPYQQMFLPFYGKRLILQMHYKYMWAYVPGGEGVEHWDGNRLAYPQRTGFRPVSDRRQISVMPDAQSMSSQCLLPHTQSMSPRHVRCTVMSDLRGVSSVPMHSVISDAQVLTE